MDTWRDSEEDCDREDGGEESEPRGGLITYMDDWIKRVLVDRGHVDPWDSHDDTEGWLDRNERIVDAWNDLKKGVESEIGVEGEPLDWGDVVESLLPRRPRGPRRGGKRAWAQRWEQMVRATLALYKAGLLAELPDGPADMTVITEAGREALWGPKPSGWITTDAVLTREEAEAWRQGWESAAQAPGGPLPEPGRTSAPSGSS